MGARVTPALFFGPGSWDLSSFSLALSEKHHILGVSTREGRSQRQACPFLPNEDHLRPGNTHVPPWESAGQKPTRAGHLRAQTPPLVHLSLHLSGRPNTGREFVLRRGVAGITELGNDRWIQSRLLSPGSLRLGFYLSLCLLIV